MDVELNVVYKGRHRRHQKKYSCSSAPCTCNNLLWMAKKYLDFSLNPFFSFFFFFLSLLVLLCNTQAWLPYGTWDLSSKTRD